MSPTTDPEQLHREAIATLIAGSAALAALCGRPTGLVIERHAVGPAVPLPCIVYDLQVFDEAAGNAALLLTGVARGPGAGKFARQLLEAARAELTQPAFASLGLEVAPLEGIRRSVDEVADITQRFNLQGTPDLAQADWSLPLLIFP